MKWINLIFFICLGSIGCDKPCPEDMTLGDIPLMESSLESIPYQEGQIIEFINEINDTLRYEVFDLRILDRSIYLGNLCKSKETNTILRTKSTHLKSNLSLVDTGERPDTGTVISFELDVKLFNLNQKKPLDTLIVDRLDICSVIYGGFKTGLKSSHNRLNAFVNLRSLTKETVSSYYQATYLKEIILNGQTFLDVYQQGFDTNKIYYNIEKGILGFVDDNGVFWIVI